MKPRAGIDVHFILMRIKKNWLFILSSLIISLLVAVSMIYILPPKYKITASIKVNDESNNAIVENLFDGVKIVEEIKNASNEIAILKSFRLIKSTIEKLNYRLSYFQKSAFISNEIFIDVPFSVVLDTAFNQIIDVPINIHFLDQQHYVLRMDENEASVFNYLNGGSLMPGKQTLEIPETVVKVGEYYQNKFLRFKINIHGTVDTSVEYFFQLHNTHVLAEDYRRNLSIAKISKDASVIEINLTSNVPEKEVKFIDQLIALYEHESTNDKDVITQRTIDFIDQQLLTISDSLKRAELGLQDFRSKNGVLDIDYESRNIYDQLKSLEKQNSDEQIRFKYFDYLSEYVKVSDGDFDKIIAPSVMGIQDPTLNELITHLSALTAQKAALDFSAKEKNPKYNMLRENIEQTRVAILENVNTIKIASQIELKDVNARLSKVKNEIDALPKTERILLSAQRKFDFSDNIYKYFLEKQGEAAILRESYVASDVVIDPARIEGTEPVSPNKKLIIAIFFFLGLIIPIGLIFTRDVLSSKILKTDDIYSPVLDAIPIIQEIPKSSKRKMKLTSINIDAYCFEAFRSLRLKMVRLKNAKIVGITSLVNGDGKTFCTINTAKALSNSGKKVLIIDLDNESNNSTHALLLKETQIAQSIVHNYGAGIEISQTNFINLNWMVINSETDKLNDEIVNEEVLSGLLKELVLQYDYILIDCRPVNHSSNFLSIENFTHLNLFIVRRNHTPSDLTKLRTIASSTISKSHFVFNFSES